MGEFENLVNYDICQAEGVRRMRSLQDIAEYIYTLVKDFVTRERLEVHEASRLADIADEIADWADKLEDDHK